MTHVESGFFDSLHDLAIYCYLGNDETVIFLYGHDTLTQFAV